MKVHERHYKSTSGSIERIEVGKLMFIAENNLIGKYRDMNLRDIQFDSKFYLQLFLSIDQPIL